MKPAVLLLLVGCGSASTSNVTGPCPATSVPLQEPTAPTEAGGAADRVAATLLQRMNARDAAGVVGTFSGAMREALPVDKATPWLAALLDQKGKLLSLARQPGSTGERDAKYVFTAERGEWFVELHVDAHGHVLGLKLTDPPPPEPIVARTTIPLSLPFRGQWSVFWGGSTLDVNQHVTHHSQRRAADLVVVDAAGKTHRGEGKNNTDYLAYGQDVLAAAAGTVITVIDGVPDNAPGSMNPYFALGNAVIVKHSDTLYSAYAHLKPSSLRTKVGAKVERGTLLGLCGNTGNSSEPHLHFQLQDGPRFESSWGVEPVFAKAMVLRNGTSESMTDYTWLKGDLVGENPKR